MPNIHLPRITPALLAIAAVFSTGVVTAAEYRVDPAHSFVQFRTQHLGYSWLIGRFNRFDGRFQYDRADGKGAHDITIELHTESIDSNHAERDKHLRGSDFLDTKRYPKAIFTSRGDANGDQVRGTLELHGVARPLEITMRKIGEGKDPWGGYRVGFEGEAVITRSDFGMDYDLGPMAKRVELSLYIEAIRQ